MTCVARALDLAAADEPKAATRVIHARALRHAAPTSLAALGMPREGLDRAADLAVQTPYPNPRPLDRAALRRTARAAAAGLGRRPAGALNAGTQPRPTA